MRWGRIGIFVVCLGSVDPILLAAPVNVEVQSTGNNTSMITLQTTVRASSKVLWDLLTDYDHHAGFLPYMSRSRVSGRNDHELFVDQEGTIPILFWSFTMRVKQKVKEDPPARMHFEAIEGDFSQLEGDWTLQPALPDGASIRCLFVVKPKRRVPDWAVRMAARHYLKKMVAVLAAKAEGNGHE